MSLVPSFVLGNDGRWYQNPVIGVGDEWFVCWDDDDPEELVIHDVGHNTTKEAATERALEIIRFLNHHGYHVGLRGRVRKSGHRLFGHQAGNDPRKLRFRPAWNCFLNNFGGAMPVELLLVSDAAYNERPRAQGVYYGG